MKPYVKIALSLGAFVLSLNTVAQSGEGYYGPTLHSGNVSHGVGTGINAFIIAQGGNYDGITNGPSNDLFGGPAFVAGDQEIAGTVAPSFNTLQIANGGSSHLLVTNTAGIDVATQLQLNNGITTTTNALAGAIRLASHATTTGSNTFSSTCYIDGYVGKVGFSAFTFPLGNAGIYSPATFTTPAGTTIRYTVGDPGTTANKSISQGALNIANVSSREYYPLNSAAISGSSVTIPFGNFGPSGYVSDPSNLTIAGWSGTAWVNLGGNFNNINTSSQTVTVVLNQSLSGFSQMALASTSPVNTLPVTLISFSGMVTNCTALLTWKTASEINSKSFNIEHSTNGISFYKTGIVKSANSFNGGSYNYTDNSLASGINYYRLKTLDLDGAFVYSDVVTLSSNCNSIAVAVSPNPVKDALTVTGLNGNNTILVIDATGRRLTTVLSNTSTQHIDMRNFSVGIYTMQVVNENGNITSVRIIK